MKTHLLFLLFLFLLLSANTLQAQKDTTIARNTIFVEFLGNGLIGSVNYDRLFFMGKNKYSLRGGLLYFPLNPRIYGNNFSIPISFSFIKGKKHHYECGLGVTYLNGFNTDYSDSLSKVISSRAIFSAIKFAGYRFQEEGGGLFFQVSALVLYKTFELNNLYRERKNERIPAPWIGFSLGYTLKNKVQ